MRLGLIDGDFPLAGGKIEFALFLWLAVDGDLGKAGEFHGGGGVPRDGDVPADGAAIAFPFAADRTPGSSPCGT